MFNYQRVREKYLNRDFFKKVKKYVIRKHNEYVEDNSFQPQPFQTIPSKHKIYIYCAAWGNYIDLMFNYTIPSMLQEHNIPKLKDNGYDIELFVYTTHDNYAEVLDKYNSISTSLKENFIMNIVPLNVSGDLSIQEHKNEFLCGAFIKYMKKCIIDNAVSVLTSADHIWGNWSLWNIVKLADGKKDVCVGAAFPRISWEAAESNEIFKQLRKGDICIENDLLVDLAFQCGHSALLDKFDNKDENSTYMGSSIRQVNDNTYSVVCNVPPTLLANFNEDDLKFFEAGRYYNDMDRGWAKTIVKHNRTKMIGSSDLFFAVELTRDNVSVAPLKKGLLNNDKHKTMSFQTCVYNTFFFSWRSRNPNPHLEGLRTANLSKKTL